jgi:hypothetical protein
MFTKASLSSFFTLSPRRESAEFTLSPHWAAQPGSSLGVSLRAIRSRAAERHHAANHTGNRNSS